MAKRETVAYVLRGMCLLWKRDFDEFIFDVYCSVCEPFADEIVKKAAIEMALTSKWFPMPQELRRLMETMGEMIEAGTLRDPRRKALPGPTTR